VRWLIRRTADPSPVARDDKGYACGFGLELCPNDKPLAGSFESLLEGCVFQVIFTVIAVVGASVHLAFSAERRRRGGSIAGTYLVYLLFFYVGVMGLLTAYAHVFRPVQTSASIGWSTSPYEYEVGMADLTVGVLGVLCLKFRGNFWLATAIANAVWLLGDAVGHLRQMTLNNNHAANNSGIFLLTEFIMPLVILSLTLYHRRQEAEVT
jgi:hypothetical protein